MKFNTQSGQVSRTLIILAVVILLAVLVIYGVAKYAAVRRDQAKPKDITKVENEVPKPVYETTVGDVRFLVQSAIDLGPVVKAELPYQQDLVTTEKFIQVTVRAQNKGKADTAPFVWNIGNIIDSTGRNFIEDQNAFYFLPKKNGCGAVLKPEFEPTPCTKIYQVSKVSDHLKIQVSATAPNASRAKVELLDLNVR